MESKTLLKNFFQKVKLPCLGAYIVLKQIDKGSHFVNIYFY